MKFSDGMRFMKCCCRSFSCYVSTPVCVVSRAKSTDLLDDVPYFGIGFFEMCLKCLDQISVLLA